jgi:hypothetical protein
MDKTQIDIVAVIGSHVPLSKFGALHKGACPFHADNSPSFVVYNNERPRAHCFGCGWSGDVYDFIQEIEGLDYTAAKARVHGSEFSARFVEREPVKKSTNSFVSMTPPKDTPSPDMRLMKINDKQLNPPATPTDVWPFYSYEGDLIGYEVRYMIDGRKEPRFISYGSVNGAAPKWHKRYPTPRPIYGLDRFAAYTENQIIITEAAKKARAAQALFPTKVCLGWTMGASSWNKHDWEILRNYRGRSPIILWPDADSQTATERHARILKIPVGTELPYTEQPGQRAMLSLARLLSNPMGLNLPVALVHVSSQGNGWDAADALDDGWTSLQARQWISERLRSVDEYPFSIG